jgi:hypothetical protein
MPRDVGRLDNIVDQLERLQREADGILDAYTDERMSNSPSGTSFGTMKHWVFRSIGSTLDRVAALKLVRGALTISTT